MPVSRALPVAVVVAVLVAGCSPAGDGAAGPSSTAASGPATSSAAPVEGDDYVAIPRTNILLRPPAGMEVDASLPGLSRGAGSRTSVLVIEQQIKGKSGQDALTEVAGAFRTEKSKAQGLEMGEARNVAVAGHPAVATTGTQRMGGVTFVKAFVALAVGEKIVMMNASVEPGDPLSAEAVLEVLSGARWGQEVAPGGFGFDLTAAPGYQRNEGSGAITFTLGEGVKAARLIAAPSLGVGAVPFDRRRDFANERFGKLPHSPSAESVQEVRIAGKPGFELTGRNSESRTVYMVILYTDAGYVVLAGDFDPAGQPDQLPAFRSMAQSLVVQ
ncbi:hypothetical protein BBK82_07015 [Lentzea guizhouensis]|uniref:DUF1795 domain-containing protein n=1 Tax=Lentzea guizhouensis TaxID=1586287 RepID=A0A1B2HDR4_9PSEU|nr:hypothetical protein BBK82_07015 [Lentzea guizhouensis]